MRISIYLFFSNNFFTGLDLNVFNVFNFLLEKHVKQNLILIASYNYVQIWNNYNVTATQEKKIQFLKSFNSVVLNLFLSNSQMV